MNFLRTRLGGGGEDEQSHQQQGQALDEYERVGNDGGTIASTTGGTNHLANRGRGEGVQPIQGQRLGQPQRGGEQYRGDPAGAGQQGGIPAEIQNIRHFDNDDVRSQVTNSVLGLGGAEGNQGERGGNPVGRTAGGGGIAAKIASIKTRNDDALMERELEWQAKVKGNNQLAGAFKEQTINQNSFRAFAFMKGKSPAVHMVHSIGQFFGLSGLAVDVQGKCIGFIGDRGNGKYPVPIILPPNNAWAWTNVNYLNDTAAFTQYYNDEDNKDKLWNTGVDDAGRLESIELPRMLALPTCVAEFVTAQKGGCLPHMIRKFVKDKIDGGETQVQAHKWLLICDWCVAASQEKDGGSILQLGTTEPALCQDGEFIEWCEQRILSTLGAELREAWEPQQGGGGRDLQLVQQITTNMGRSFLAGIQTLAPTIAGATRQLGPSKEGGDDVGGKLYSENNVAALKGYCGVVDPMLIPTIWDAFQQTKEINSHRHSIRVSMSKWSKDTGKDIDKAPFFTEQTIKDIVGLNFNPGEAVPTFSSAQRGISILTCRPKSAHEVETIKEFEEARRATAHTAQFNDVRRRQKAPPSPPPDNYFELRLGVNTFCALVWTLFGDECDYYKGLLEVAETLDQQEVHIIREAFTPDICRRITWAILTDGRSFFNTVLVESQFKNNERFKWPTSLIHKVTDDVRFAKAIDRPMYPTEWIIPAHNQQGGTLGNSGGGGLGGGGHSTNPNGQQQQLQRPAGMMGGGGGVRGGGRGGGGGGGGGGRYQQRQPWTDDRHPRIAAMMADYVAAKGPRIKLLEILDACNKRITDLPTIPEYVANGRPFVCWAHILGRCTFDNCQFKNGHVPRSAIPDSFADAVVAMLTPGVVACTPQGRDQENSPAKRQRNDGQQA
jgi:hypothetical protein